MITIRCYTYIYTVVTVFIEIQILKNLSFLFTIEWTHLYIESEEAGLANVCGAEGAPVHVHPSGLLHTSGSGVVRSSGFLRAVSGLG
jgi:hypothetical protein